MQPQIEKAEWMIRQDGKLKRVRLFTVGIPKTCHPDCSESLERGFNDLDEEIFKNELKTILGDSGVSEKNT